MVLLLCLTSACQDKAAINELEGFRTQSAIEAQNEAAVRRQMAEFNKQNMDIGDVMNTPDYKLHFPIQSEPKNTSQHREVLETFWGAFPDMTHTLDKLSSSGDTVTAIYTIRASHSGEFMGIPGTGKQIEEPVIGIWRFSDGKIAEFWGVLDMASLMQQLGMELKPGEPAT
jgi:predicted ester cyclase